MCLGHFAVSPYALHPSRKELACQVVTDLMWLGSVSP
jgi:hypothetical protein